MDILFQIALPVLVTGLFNLAVFLLQQRYEKPKSKAEVNGLKATTQKTLQETIDGLAHRIDAQEEIIGNQAKRIDKLEQALDDNKVLLAAEIQKRKTLEAANLLLIDGIMLLIEQLEVMGVEPAWRPNGK